MPSKASAIPAGYKPIPGSERRPSKTAIRLGPANADEVFAVTISLRRRPDGSPLPDHDHFLNVHPAERQRLSEEEFARRYGASQEDIDKVVAFATSHHLSVVATHAARRTVIVEGTVARMNAAFAVDLGRYEQAVTTGRKRVTRTETYRGRDGVVHVPGALADIIVGVFGLDNRRIARHNGAEPPNTGTLTVPTVASLYQYPTNTAAGQTIGIFSADGYDIADINQYFASLGAPYVAPTVNDILINGATNPGFDPELEVTQDIEIAASFAPGAAINVYIATDDQQGWVQAIGRAAHPDAGDSAPSVLSSSFFLADGDDTAGLTEPFGISLAFVNAVSAAFQDAAIQAITVCIASGDRGTDSSVGDGKCHVQYPAADPWVLSVGGTTVGNVNGANFDEYVWNDTDADPSHSNWGTTGGGVSAHFPVPSYQSAISVPPSLDDPTHHGRGVPDVSGNANIASGYGNIVWQGSTTTGNGTSASAPQWAGLVAVMNAALGVNLGFINPALYALAGTGFRDIVPGSGPGDNANNGSPGYPAGAGWDACTGWGSPRGAELLAGLRSIYNRTLYFIVDKSTFGLDEVSDMVATAGGLYSQAFWLVLEGFSISQVGGAIPSLAGAFHGLTGVSIFPDGAGASYEYPGDLYTPQRIRFPFDIIFSQQAVMQDFPASGTPALQEPLTASITVAGATLSAAALFELVSGADPYFTNVDPAHHQDFYLSQDLRVFSAAAGDTPLPGAPAMTNDPYASIRNLLEFLNGSSSYTTPGPDPLNGLPGQNGYETGDSSVTPLDGSGQRNFNFAIARVRLQGLAGSSADNVRVFFRLFVAPSCDTDFQPATTYLSQIGTGAEAGLPVFPLASATGLSDPQGNAVQTIPFFASDAAGTHDYDGTLPNCNIRTVQIPAAGDKVWAYFGCYLDVYDASNQSLFPGTHHCIVAQIAYDDAPILNAGGVTLSPENSDKLAQRNLQITSSGNPGYPLTHRIPQAFDTRASVPANATGELQDYPDELMIDWGNVPVGSTAAIYWPDVDVDEVLALATRLYGAHRLTAADANTLHCRTTRGVSYVPIPFAVNRTFAGLFTVDLPNGIHVGQEFNVKVRRVASRRASRGTKINAVAEATAARGNMLLNWRYVTGSFQVKIPVGEDAKLLRPDENVLAILKWRLEQFAPSYRWRPVVKRLIGYLSGRIIGFGGDPGTIKPSPTGLPVAPGGGHGAGHGTGHGTGHGGEICWRGKVTGVIYDMFGDFEAFRLATEHGEHCFEASEPAIEMLVRRAWLDRMLVLVTASEHAPRRPVSIDLLRAPHPLAMP